KPIFFICFISYTALGGAILVGYWATRERSRDVRLGVAAAVVLAVFLWHFALPRLVSFSTGYGVSTPSIAQKSLSSLDQYTEDRLWQPGNDVLVYRPGYIESDLLASVPSENRERVEAAIRAPLRTLYACRTGRKPVVVLTLSNRRGEVHTR